MHAMMVSLPREEGGEGGVGFGDQKRFVFEPRKRMLVELYRGTMESGEVGAGGLRGERERERGRLLMRQEQEDQLGEEGEGEGRDGGRALWKRRREEEERMRGWKVQRRKEELRKRWEVVVGGGKTRGLGWKEDWERERDEKLVGEKEDLECPM